MTTSIGDDKYFTTTVYETVTAGNHEPIGIKPIEAVKLGVRNLRAVQTKNAKCKIPGTERWLKCACGTVHPTAKTIKLKTGPKCTFYLEVSELFPNLSCYQILMTEVKFLRADTNLNEALTLVDVTRLIRSMDPQVSDRAVEASFYDMDTECAGSLDFVEVLAVLENLRLGESVNARMHRCVIL